MAGRDWEEELREAAARGEDELKRAIRYINDEVVPEVRRNGSVALRRAAVELERLAQRMDDRRAGPPEKDAPRS